MTAACSIYFHDTDATPRRPSPFPRLLLFGLAITLIILGAHAVIKHKTDAELVRQCLDNGGQIQMWEDPFGRRIRVCQLPDGKFGIQVCERWNCKWEEVTSFIKHNASKIADVEDYIANSKAIQMWLKP